MSGVRRLSKGFALAVVVGSFVIPADRSGAGAADSPSCTFHSSNGALDVVSRNSQANLFLAHSDSGQITAGEHTFPPPGNAVIEPIPCPDADGGAAAPTAATVESISVTSAATVVVVGEFGPGRSAEQGADEIEIELDAPAVSLQPPDGATEMAFGWNPANKESGGNLNGGAEAGGNADIDLALDSPISILVLAGDGHNVIDGGGVGSLPRPYNGTLSAYGGSGRDEFRSGSGVVGLFAGFGGDDVLRGGPQEDGMLGDSGNDRLVGRGGDDHLDGERGDDRVRGGAGEDKLKGSYGSDRISGGSGHDRLLGGVGDDLLLARDGQRDREVSCWHGSDKHEAARVDRKDPRPRSC